LNGCSARINAVDDDIARALAEIAYVAGELQAVRDAGFTAEALKYPRSRKGLIALCAFNGIKPEQAPRGWHYWPNKGMQACWERVIAALAADT
jgi:hypothetical protein